MKHVFASVMRGVRSMAFISIAMGLASCSPMIDSRGYGDVKQDLSQIIEGQSTREDVAVALGTPSSTSRFGEPIWYYIHTRKETYAFLAPEVAAQEVTAIHFDAQGVVKKIEKTHGEKAKSVAYVEKTTPTEGHNMTFIEQIMGNFGRFNTPGRGIDSRNMGR